MSSPEKPIRWSLHAFARASRRHVELGEALLTVNEPEVVVPGDAGRRIYMRRSTDRETGQPLLIRVIVEELTSERVVVSVVATSKVAKYLREVSQ